MNHYATEVIVNQQIADRRREADEYRLARAVRRARSAEDRVPIGSRLTSRPRPVQVRVALVAAMLALLATVGAGAAAQAPSEDPGCIVVSGGKLAC